ncbi:DUF2231 domain-containing protein [Luedemannella helvata]|uniref:DUF2231 domain-containing protein n=1 Tax=Luedemannella helvata TaxID=349315 RepID=A0ABP4WX55_9ACTN
MRSRTRVQGEPVSPMLAMLALGIFANVLLLDLGGLVADFSFFGLVAFWSMLAGLVAALPAAVAAIMDMLAAPSDSVRSAITRHGLADIGMVGLFGVVWLGRLAGQREGNGWYLAVEALAFAIGMAGAWSTRGRMLAERPPATEPSPLIASGAGLTVLDTVRLTWPPRTVTTDTAQSGATAPEDTAAATDDDSTPEATAATNDDASDDVTAVIDTAAVEDALASRESADEPPADGHAAETVRLPGPRATPEVTRAAA